MRGNSTYSPNMAVAAAAAAEGVTLSITAPRVEVEELERETDEMTTVDRAQAFADVYGTEKAMPETPEMLDEHLTSMQIELDYEVAVAAQRETAAYQTARERSPEHTNSVELHLLFLRSEFFDAKAAAKKMIQYWKMKVRLFGEEVAYRSARIRLDDLTDEDLASLHNEGIMLLPEKDLAGRVLLLSTRQNWIYERKENPARLMMYILLQIVMDDISVQRNGVVAILFDDGEFSLRRHYDRKLDRLVIDMLKCLPIRLVGVHHFFDAKTVSIILPFLLFCFGRKYRARYRIYGQKDTRTKGLLECGIAMDILPTRIGGGLTVTPASILEARRQAEQETEDAAAAEPA